MKIYGSWDAINNKKEKARMHFKNSIISALILFLYHVNVYAAPVTSLDFHVGLNTGHYIEERDASPDTVDWFVFQLTSTKEVTFWFDRTQAEPDLRLTLYRGDTRGFDYVSAGAGTQSSTGDKAEWRNTDLEFIIVRDDSHEDAYGGSFGDPHFEWELTPGFYSLALYNVSVLPGGYEFTTNVSSVSTVPLPAAFWLFGSAFAGIGFIVRKRKGIEAS